MRYSEGVTEEVGCKLKPYFIKFIHFKLVNEDWALRQVRSILNPANIQSTRTSRPPTPRLLPIPSSSGFSCSPCKPLSASSMGFCSKSHPAPLPLKFCTKPASSQQWLQSGSSSSSCLVTIDPNLGFGLLFAYQRRLVWSAIGFNLLITCLTI